MAQVVVGAALMCIGGIVNENRQVDYIKAFYKLIGHGLMGVLMHPPLLTFFGIFIYPWVCGVRKSMLTGKILGPKVPPMEFFDHTHFS